MLLARLFEGEFGVGVIVGAAALLVVLFFRKAAQLAEARRRRRGFRSRVRVMDDDDRDPRRLSGDR